MQKTFLYQQIVESIRNDIINGKLKPGDRLPSIRTLTKEWDCTPGTIQRAYNELAKQELVVSRAGQGTQVISKPSERKEKPIRKAELIHRADSFLLEVLTAGYSPGEIEQAVKTSLDRWRVIQQTEKKPPTHKITFTGSHDIAINWLASNFREITRQYEIELNFTGSLGGLIALAKGEADLAGSHLWDADSDTYNFPFIKRLLPGRRIAVLTLASRKLGMVLPPGNPLKISSIADLPNQEIQFINRQRGSGTRVWLDENLKKLKIIPSAINGYNNEKYTHSEIAQAIAEGEASAGIALETSALDYGLDFIFLTKERYDLVFTARNMESAPFKALIDFLNSPQAKEIIQNLGGYDTQQTGELVILE